MSKDSEVAEGEFLPLIHDGEGEYAGLYCHGEEVSLATINIIQEGRPFNPDRELIRLERQPDSPAYKTRVLNAGRKGPAQVATSTYRGNYDAIFGASRKSKLLN